MVIASTTRTSPWRRRITPWGEERESHVNVLFINYHHLDSNSGIHIFNLANHLSRLGVQCTVCVPDSKDAVKHVGKPLFQVIDFKVALRTWWHTSRSQQTDLIHAWTPRELVRELTEELVERLHCPYVIHLEDNENAILTASIGMPLAALKKLEPNHLTALVGSHMSHPLRSEEFLHRSSGITVLIDTLQRLKPESIPSEVIWPGYDEELQWDLPVDNALRRRLGIADSEYVVVYTGNVHAANRDEVLSLYLAVALVNRRGIAVKLVRTGTDHVTLFDETLDAIRDYCVELGHIPRRKVPSVLSLADALVQPGRSSEFNDYRFPSKLPEWLASGRPVLLPHTNIGRYLKDSEECVILREGNALEISQKLEQLFCDKVTRERIGAGGKAFAERNLKWSKSADRLHAFYARVIQQQKEAAKALSEATAVSDATEPQSRVSSEPPPRDTKQHGHIWYMAPLRHFSRLFPSSDSSAPPLIDRGSLRRLAYRYSRYVVQPLSYATVRDYCDSMDHLRELATLSGDMKDVQRPWVLKAILSTLPPGSRLLEIGAGNPMVAHLLSELGYQITVVDPYDGSGHGPTEYEAFVKAYPRLSFLRKHFSYQVAELEPGSFDCVFSISVLEHVPGHEIPGVLEGIRRFVREERGCSIHAIDHVLRGWGGETHLEKLQLILGGMGIPGTQLEDLLARTETDPETYFLSAYGHNLWRGARSYEEFPMRRCVSIHVCMEM